MNLHAGIVRCNESCYCSRSIAELPENATFLTHQQRLVCYAQRYSDLLLGYCNGKLKECDWKALEQHWQNHGRFEKREFGCPHVQYCTQANFNLLNLVDEDKVPYNMCRNLEWQVCAAQGRLPGQGGRKIRFSYAPKEMDVNGKKHSLETCAGWHPGHAPKSGGGIFGFTNDDIYFMEICLFNQVCENNFELFTLDKGQNFICKFSAERFAELEAIIRTPPLPEPTSTLHCTIHGGRTSEELLEAGINISSHETISCKKCEELHSRTPGECSDLRECERCSFCQAS